MFIAREDIGTEMVPVRADEVFAGDVIAVSDIFHQKPIAFEVVTRADIIGDDVEFVTDGGTRFSTSIGNAVTMAVAGPAHDRAIEDAASRQVRGWFEDREIVRAIQGHS